MTFSNCRKRCCLRRRRRSGAGEFVRVGHRVIGCDVVVVVRSAAVVAAAAAGHCGRSRRSARDHSSDS